MKRKQLIISGIVDGSIAEEAGISRGDELLSVNGRKIRDVFDYRFLTAAEHVVIAVLKPDAEILEADIEKDEYEDVGLQFDDPMMDDVRRCTNKCIFCFIDQLPEGMRETLYFKDDDTRLSFIRGNYVTLTNTGPGEIERIIRYRMSPVNISVHAADVELRRQMLGNRNAGDIMEAIGRLVRGGIVVNCQIVLCRGINDNAVLDDTVRKLAELHPGMASISVVPVGLTRYRAGLKELQPYDAPSSTEVLKQVEGLQEEFLKSRGSRIVYAADEFYIMAGTELPAEYEYEGYPQIENGVGMLTSFIKGFDDYLDEIGYNSCKACCGNIAGPEGRAVASVVTGEAAYPYIRRMASAAECVFRLIAGNERKGYKINVYPVRNDFFGNHITTAGLLTGEDILKQLAGKEIGDMLFLSCCTLREGTDTFLDGVTLKDLEKAIGVTVRAVDNTGRGFAEALLGCRQEGR